MKVGGKLELHVGITVASVLLVILSAGLGFVWSFRLGAYRKVVSYRWVRLHSREAYWSEVKRSVRRWNCWNNGIGYAVAFNGDKHLAEWMLTSLDPRGSFGCQLGDCHPRVAIKYLINRDIGSTQREWLAWWTQNRNKTQDEWVTEGFQAYGACVSTNGSLSEADNNVVEMLRLVGSKEVPIYVRYNAFRRLHKPGFRPASFLLSFPYPEIDVVREGTSKYECWHENLNCGYPHAQNVTGFAYWISKPITLILVWGSIFGCWVGAAFLLLRYGAYSAMNRPLKPG